MADEIITVDSLVQKHAAAKADTGAQTTDTKTTDSTTTITDKGGQQQTVDTTAPDPVKDLLKELNLESLDALKERLKPKEEPLVESPEEKEKRENLYRVDMQKYAVENGLMKPDEFSKLEQLKQKADQDLVFEGWLPGWKEENPDVDPTEVDAKAKEDFESEYALNSENEKKKARGLARVEKEAKGIRSPLESSFTKVKTEFDEDREISRNLPDYNKKLAGFIQENIPEKIKLFETKDGEDTVPVEIELTADQRKAIYAKVDQKLRNSSTYQLYKKNDLKQLQEIAKKEAEAEIWNEHREAGLKKIAETFLKRGDDKGYKRGVIGAKNPFPLTQDNKQTGGTDHQSAQQQVLDSLHGKK